MVFGLNCKSYTDHVKSGFFYIAQEADVPIRFGNFNYKVSLCVHTRGVVQVHKRCGTNVKVGLSQCLIITYSRYTRPLRMQGEREEGRGLSINIVKKE